MEFCSNVRIPNKNTWKKQGDERLFVFIWANFISVKKKLGESRCLNDVKLYKWQYL